MVTVKQLIVLAIIGFAIGLCFKFVKSTQIGVHEKITHRIVFDKCDCSLKTDIRYYNVFGVKLVQQGQIASGFECDDPKDLMSTVKLHLRLHKEGR